MHIAKHIAFQSLLNMIAYMNTGGQHMRTREFNLCPVSTPFPPEIKTKMSLYLSVTIFTTNLDKDL